jgi:hypothetical protein
MGFSDTIIALSSEIGTKPGPIHRKTASGLSPEAVVSNIVTV